MKNKKLLILSIIGSLLLVSIAIASSYAYFVANVSGNKDTNNVVVTNGVMSLKYTDGDEINLANAVPGNSVTKTFTVKNTGNVSTNYTIYFSELSNKFVDKTDLVYTLTSSDGGKSVAQTQVPSTNEAMVSNYSIDAGKTHTYTLTITFLNKDENQNDNMGVSFSTKIGINESVEYKEPRNADQIIELAAKDTTNFATNDPDNNIRYIGANPNNYVYFNCSDYSNQSDSTCEKWRIIGVFKNMTKEDGSKAALVKIIRDDSLGDIAWDYKRDGAGTSTSDYDGSNDWTDSQLMMMLNPIDYLKSGYTIDNNIVKDSNGQAIYQNMGSYYNGTSGCEPAAVASGEDFTCTSIDFTSTGLKNDLTRNAIESVVWNLGGTASYTSASNGLASHFYAYERGTTVYSGRPTTWTGKIALMYPSDYGYATSGNSTTNRAVCLAKELYNWLTDDFENAEDCYSNDYLYSDSYDQWTLAPESSFFNGAFYVGRGGYVDMYDSGVNCSIGVRSAAFLKSNILLSGVGDGSSTSPYQLKVG